MNIISTTENCEKCLNYCSGHCTAFIYFNRTEIEKYGTNKCPAYIDENTKWRITIWQDKE